MKQIEFKTSNGGFLVVELNERERRGIDYNPILKLISRITDITEEQAKEVVDYCITGLGYNDYNGSICFGLRLTAIESLNTTLEANGVIFENPYRDVGCIPSAEQKLYRDFKDKIWNKQQTYLFKKIC